MKTKVGLLLGGEPHSGGLYQYNLSMLDAVAALPRSNYDVIGAYLLDEWRRELESRDLPAVSIRRPFVKRGATAAMRKLRVGAPVGLGGEQHAVQTLARLGRDVWLAPTHDVLAFAPDVKGYGSLNVVATIHDLMHRYEPQFPEVSANGIHEQRERLYRGLCGVAAGILVDSEVGRAHVHESYRVPIERIFPLPFVPPQYIFSPTPPGFDQRYALPAKYVFYPAQFWEHKNHARLLRALALAKASQPDVTLVFVGSTRHSGYAPALELARELGLQDSVTFLGYVPNEDMPELYRRARAMIFASLLGPTNIPPLEAFALGCPCAVSRVYAMPEQVGDAALLFDPRSESDMAQTLLRLWRDGSLCAELSRRGTARASRWTQADFAARLRNIIERVASEHARSSAPTSPAQPVALAS